VTGKERLLAFWNSRTPRERVVLKALAAVIGIALYVSLVQSADHARTRLGTAVATLRAQAASLNAQAREIERLRAAPPATRSKTDLRELVQAQAGAAGLSQSIVRLDSSGADQVQVAFGAVPFAQWLAWVANLQAEQVRLSTCRIEALSAPGTVSVTATFLRGR
jgi:general secretion pathway protein M